MMLSRKEKERLYIRKATELQLRWKNAIDDDDFLSVSEMTNKQLDKALQDTVGQLRFEKVWDGAGTVLWIGLITFVVLGVAGLLLFGVRQLF